MYKSQPNFVLIIGPQKTKNAKTNRPKCGGGGDPRLLYQDQPNFVVLEEYTNSGIETLIGSRENIWRIEVVVFGKNQGKETIQVYRSENLDKRISNVLLRFDSDFKKDY